MKVRKGQKRIKLPADAHYIQFVAAEYNDGASISVGLQMVNTFAKIFNRTSRPGFYKRNGNYIEFDKPFPKAARVYVEYYVRKAL